jgi:signal transduction histidine kinase
MAVGTEADSANLISNAIQFSAPADTVSIQIRSRSNHDLEVTVAEIGIGVDESYLERVLEPFC